MNETAPHKTSTNRRIYNYTMKYYSAIKMNELLVHLKIKNSIRSETKVYPPCDYMHSHTQAYIVVAINIRKWLPFLLYFRFWGTCADHAGLLHRDTHGKVVYCLHSSVTYIWHFSPCYPSPPPPPTGPPLFPPIDPSV